MKRISIIDVSAILHTVKHAIGKKNKLSHNEEYTFITFGFLFRLRSVLVHSKPDIVVFALDSKSSIRKDKIYPLYKNKRSAEKTDEQKHLDNISFPQFDIVQNELLPDLGYKNIFKAKGFEADDIIGKICQTYGKEFEICIVTSDEDMYQCLRPNIVILNPRNYTFFTMAKFKEKYKIGHPVMWERVKVYGGCSSDSIPGLPIPNDDPTKKVRHIAEQGAINFIQGKINPSTNTYKAFICEANKPIIQRNKNLVILPLSKTPLFTISTDRDLYKKSLVDICDRFNFQSVLADLDDFCSVMKLR